jgi:polysaccharide pyruvyl transferase WcaK-like protein
MKIAVFGYYNALNFGDDRLQHCITRLLAGHTVVFLPHYLPVPKSYLQDFDWILIGGGGLVFERVGIWVNMHRWLRQCRAKVGVFGLGVNRMSPELKPELDTLLAHAKFFFVRDEKSKALLNHPKVEVFPDLTWCFPIAHDVIPQTGGIALNLVSCPWKPYSSEAWIKTLPSVQIHPFPFHFAKDRDAALLSEFFPNVPSEFSLLPLLQSQLLVACRFHAIVFAMQLGKPFVAISYDDKVSRLVTESDLSECLLETTDHNLLPAKIDYVIQHQAELQHKIAAYAVQQKYLSQCLVQKLYAHLEVKSDQRPYLMTSIKTKLRQVFSA